MKTLVMVFALVLAPSLAQAQAKVGIMGSFLWNTTENRQIDEIEGSEEKSLSSGGVGIRALINITDRLILRTGAAIVQKKFENNFTGPAIEGNQKFSFTYLSIPVTIYIPAGQQFAFFAGTALQAKLESSCKGSTTFAATSTRCRLSDDKSLVLPAILGFDIAFNESLSAEISYEFGIMETMKDTKVSSAVASLIWNF